MLSFLLIQAALSEKLIRKTYQMYVVPREYKDSYGSVKTELYNLEKELDYLEDIYDAEDIKNKHVKEAAKQYYKEEYDAEKGIIVVSEDEINNQFKNIPNDVELLKLKIKTNTTIEIDFNQLSHKLIVEESGELILDWDKEIQELQDELAEKRREYNKINGLHAKTLNLKSLAIPSSLTKRTKDDDHTKDYPTATFVGGNIAKVSKISFEETQIKFVQNDFAVEEFDYDGNFVFQNNSMKIAARIFVIELDDLIEQKITDIEPMLNVTYFVVDISEITELQQNPWHHMIIVFGENTWGLYKRKGNQREPIIKVIGNNFTKGFGIQSHEKLKHVRFEIETGGFRRVAGFIFIKVDFSRNTTMSMKGLGDINSRKHYDYAEVLDDDSTVTLAQDGEWDQVEKPKVTFSHADGVKLDNQLSSDWVVQEERIASDYQAPQEKKGLSGGAIAGIVIACVVVVAAIIVVTVLVVRKKKHQKQDDNTNKKEQEKIEQEEKETV